MRRRIPSPGYAEGPEPGSRLRNDPRRPLARAVPCRYINPIGKEVVDVRVVRVQRDGLGVPEQDFLEPFVEPDASPEPEPEYPLVLVTWHEAWFDFDALQELRKALVDERVHVFAE